ncbi:MAG TPA: SBBP repeat-containing protein, partial [Candidatus Obscuribacterales bacterium]
MPENNNYIWARSLGGSNDDFTTDISLDSARNIYLSGNFESTDFDPGTGTTLINQGLSDIFFAKLDNDGNPAWAKSLGGSKDDFASGISADDAGNVYITGNFDSTDFDPGTGTNLSNQGGSDIFIAKLDSNGNPVWAKSLGGSKDDFTNSISADDAGNVYITGSFESIDFDPGTGTNLPNQGRSDILVAKLDSSGNLVWAKNLGGSKNDSATDISLDSDGNIYLTGNFESIDFDSGTGTNLINQGGSDIFIAQLDASGNPLWVENWGGSKDDSATGISLDSDGNIYLSGNFESTDFDPGTGTNLPNQGLSDIFIAQLENSGKPLWAKSFGGGKNDFATGINLDSDGNVYTTGDFDSTDFDPGTGTNLPNQGRSDIFVARLENSGNPVWAKNLGGSKNDSATGINLDSDGNIYLSGNFDSTDFDPGAGTNLTHQGRSDIFVSKLGYLSTGVSIIQTKNSTNVSEDGTITDNYTIALTSIPTALVTVTLTPSNAQIDLGARAGLPITLNFAADATALTPQTVNFTVINDPIAEGNHSSIITHSGSSFDSTLVFTVDGIAGNTVTVNITDNDTVGIDINSSDTLTTETLETATFNIALTSQPTSDVLISLTNNDTTEGTLSTNNINFNSTTWSTPQLVTVTGVDDDIQDGDISYSIIASVAESSNSQYGSLPPETLTFINQDDDSIGININPSDTLITSETLETATFNIALTSQPTSDVLISLTNNDTTEGTLSTNNITFNSTNWSTPQLVTVTGVDDDIQDGDISYSIIASVVESSNSQYGSLPPETLTFINTDDDSIGININPSDTLTTETGKTGSFELTLTSQPTSDVLISLTNNDTTEG